MEPDDDFEVPEEYRPRPLPTLWDWIKGPLHEAEYPTQVATITDVPVLVAVPQVAVTTPGQVPQYGVGLVKAPVVKAAVDIGALLKKDWSLDLSKALKEKYGDVLGAEMSRQRRSKNTTATKNEESLKRLAEEKLGTRDSQNATEGQTTSRSSGGLNQKGVTVSNLTKGTGQGFAAGVPAQWHVHFDHVKFGKSKATRINFTGRTKSDILVAFRAQEPPQGGVNHPSWTTCLQWMLANLT